MSRLDESTVELIPLVGFWLLVILAIRFALHHVDKSQIISAARRKGWRRMDVKWRPFAPGWFFENGERHYRVTYDDKNRFRKSKFCKTGLLTGVYWRD